jgi:hypothetical protein|nr:MAG TPA: hypothetical protein [Caudoviricetes sp.]DAS14653.1 MAG TPA: hypothetical protein [Caudoviricetes sp.]
MSEKLKELCFLVIEQMKSEKFDPYTEVVICIDGVSVRQETEWIPKKEVADE